MKRLYVKVKWIYVKTEQNKKTKDGNMNGRQKLQSMKHRMSWDRREEQRITSYSIHIQR